MLASSDAARRTDEQITGYQRRSHPKVILVRDFKLFKSMTQLENLT